MIDPVVVDVTIQREPEKAFELFTSRIADWWPLDTHSLGAADKKRPATVVMEPHEGGRIYEVSDDGVERIWGSVTDWRPGDHVAFTWHVGRAPEDATKISVKFRPADSGGTHITLTHDNWHALGDEARSMRDQYSAGWTGLLNDNFLPFVKAA